METSVSLKMLSKMDSKMETFLYVKMYIIKMETVVSLVI